MEKEPMYAVMVEGKQTPAKTYDSLTLVEEEAKRLAIKERATTYIMKAIVKIELVDVKVTRME